ncbi:uncharacterized protein LOC110649219 isoform X2 [Hevea brasiliensis]|uniref:uncharacterized protein LOC110649219 isoform X2 n=1 Tax=Hevea brasiliensis TaxID=3981 RepID=UPI0025EDD3AC|nr:uncharacterized protein LOC110649219 isoform X2 [Hevea brasiliensis]
MFLLRSSHLRLFIARKTARCERLEIFASQTKRLQETHMESQLEIQIPQPLFSPNKIIPNLEILSLIVKHAKMILEGHFPADLFHKLKVVQLNYFHDKSAIFPFDLLQLFYNMEKLFIWCSHFEELFPYEGLVDKEKHASSLAQIRYLELDLLPDLKYIWNQHSQLDQVLQNLETLKVKRCDNLISLAPSSASFQNLTNLDIENCSGLSSLVTCSAAKSLVQLTELGIKGCDGLTEIVANEGDESKKDIIFCKLKSLGIHCLPSLVCFCSAEHIFKFPSLTQVILRQCPKMQVFSKGVLSTPRLRRIRLTEEVNDKGRWNGNLNTTIDQLFAEMNTKEH